jgi:hypothetical protein
LLPAVSPDEARRIRGGQEIVVRYEPDKAVATLPLLLAKRGDRERLLKLLDDVLADPRLQTGKATSEQRAMLARIRAVLRPSSRSAARHRGAPKKTKARKRA